MKLIFLLEKRGISCKMECGSDEEEIQCMDLLQGNYQLFMHWPSSLGGADGVAIGAGVGGGFNSGGEGCSASTSSSVTANLQMNLYSGDSCGGGDGPSSSPVPAMSINNPLAANRFWHTIKSRPLIKTAIVRYYYISCSSIYSQWHSNCTFDGI